MNPRILITGGTGLVGLKLSRLLSENGYDVIHLSRSSHPNSEFDTYTWDLKNKTIDKEALNVDYVIHLAGAGVADKRWTISRKELIRSSRIDSAAFLLDAFRKEDKKLKGFISASAIGIYGFDTGSDWMKEDSQPGDDYLANVVVDWEKAADEFNEISSFVSKIRIGIVLSNEGGALPQLTRPIKFGVGAPIGSGKQYMSWIHIEDLCQMFLHILKNQKSGSFNAVAPQPATNTEITRIAAKKLRMPLFLPNVPGFVLKLVFGEMANILLGGNRVSCDKIQQTGFQFQYEYPEIALADLLKN